MIAVRYHSRPKTMLVTTAPATYLDMVRFEIATGAIYDGPQIVRAELESVKPVGDCGVYRLVFVLVDDSRGMFERVATVATWPLIRACQNDTKTQKGADMMALRIMAEYWASRYVYA